MRRAGGLQVGKDALLEAHVLLCLVFIGWCVCVSGGEWGERDVCVVAEGGLDDDYDDFDVRKLQPPLPSPKSNNSRNLPAANFPLQKLPVAA